MLPAPQQLTGPFNFLGKSPEELRRLVPDAEQILPAQLRIYQEDETATPLLTGSMATLDAVNTDGFYSEAITLSAANGFEKGKSYAIRIAATVNSVAAATFHNFQMEAEVDANVVSDKTGYALSAAGVDAVWDEPLAAHTTADTPGQVVNMLTQDTVTLSTDVALGSIVGQMLDNGTAWSYDRTTDSQEALRDNTGTAGAGLTAVPWNAAWHAEVQSEDEDALIGYRLDKLLAADSDIDGVAPPTVGSVFHELMSKTAGSFTFDQTTDSLEAVRDKLTDIETDSAEIGAAGAGFTNINLPNQTMDIVGSRGTCRAPWGASLARWGRSQAPLAR